MMHQRRSQLYLCRLDLRELGLEEDQGFGSTPSRTRLLGSDEAAAVGGEGEVAKVGTRRQRCSSPVHDSPEDAILYEPTLLAITWMADRTIVSSPCGLAARQRVRPRVRPGERLTHRAFRAPSRLVLATARVEIPTPCLVEDPRSEILFPCGRVADSRATQPSSTGEAEREQRTSRTDRSIVGSIGRRPSSRSIFGLPASVGAAMSGCRTVHGRAALRRTRSHSSTRSRAARVSATFGLPSAVSLTPRAGRGRGSGRRRSRSSSTARLAEDRLRLVLQRLADEGRDRAAVVGIGSRGSGSCCEDPHDGRVHALLAGVALVGATA